MQLKQERGQYGNGDVIRLGGSFRVDSTNDPDVIRDGNSALILSVVRASAGKFTVTFASDFPIPERLTSWHVDLAQAANPTVWARAHMIVDSYSQVTRSFQIQCLKATDADTTTDTASDPDDNSMIAFELVGSINSAGTDAA